MPLVSAWKSYALYLSHTKTYTVDRRMRNFLLYLLVIELLHVVTVSVSDRSFLAMLLSKINNGLQRI